MVNSCQCLIRKDERNLTDDTDSFVLITEKFAKSTTKQEK